MESPPTSRITNLIKRGLTSMEKGIVLDLCNLQVYFLMALEMTQDVQIDGATRGMIKKMMETPLV